MTPDPDVDPDPDQVNAPVGNEYTMYGDPGPFAIPCRISVIGGDYGTLEWLSQSAGSDWALSRSPPNPLPRSFNLSSGAYWDVPGVYPTYYTDCQEDPEYPLGSGLGFSQLNGLPASNSVFGKRDVYHYLTNLIATAKTEVFYESTGTTHPPGASRLRSQPLVLGSERRLAVGLQP